MRICFMCDLHLPFDKNALQYDALDYAIEDIKIKKPDCICYAGDVTCDGSKEVYDYFIDKMSNLEIPFLYIPGNSDLRDEKSSEALKKKASCLKNVIGDVTIYAINDCEMEISDETFFEIEKADEDSVVFLHHPIVAYNGKCGERLRRWVASHKDTYTFYAHMHKSFKEGNLISLQALDPDKAIGEEPCITYYDTKTKSISYTHYPARVLDDMYGFFGISCYDCLAQIEFATKMGLKHLELRPNALDVDEKILGEYIRKWRASGGETLSVHLGELGCEKCVVQVDEKRHRLLELAKSLGASRLCQHVPKVMTKDIEEYPDTLDVIADFFAKELNSFFEDITIGIENMHMTSKDDAYGNRRYGYTPEEVLEFVELLKKKTHHRVGVNFDIGHARNNAPFSQKYQIGTWLSMLGKYIVGYHIHQVTYENGIFENHMPITDVYGHLISYASFFKNWEMGKINKASIIFEMRPEDAYPITLKTFEEYKKKTKSL